MKSRLIWTRRACGPVCRHRSLTTVELNNNNIGDEGAKALAEALRVNHTLRKLDLRGNNGSGDAGKEALREAVKGRAGFTLYGV